MEDNHVQQVQAFLNTIEGLKHPNVFTRDEILERFENTNDHCYTCILRKQKDTRRIWEKRSRLRTVELNKKKFIRKDKNIEPADNLGALPTIE
jgi:hypothetical protein